MSRFEPRDRSEFTAWSERWPLLFRPSDTDRARETGPSAALTARAVSFMQRVSEDSDAVLGLCSSLGRDSRLSGALLVDPAGEQVVMTCAHALRLLLERHGERLLEHPVYSPTMLVIAGVAAVARGECAPLVALPRDQYLCTGLELFLAAEPDLASSMALVHSRIASVVYAEGNSGDGGLGSRYDLHTLRSINHRFRVFRLKGTTASPTNGDSV